MNLTRTLATAALVASLGGCADDPNRRAETGAAIGALAGAVVGNQVSHGRGTYIGAAVGALAGAGVGHYMDKQHAELERQLKAEEDRKELSITRLSDDSLKIGIASDASFDVASSQMKANAMTTFSKIAAVLKDYDKTVIHVVGHTDSDGSDQYNQTLSENRAATVTTFMGGQGVPGTRLRQEGRGEREPIATNSTADGKAKNRRVDIVIKAVVEGNEEAAWAPPPYLGS